MFKCSEGSPLVILLRVFSCLLSFFVWGLWTPSALSQYWMLLGSSPRLADVFLFERNLPLSLSWMPKGLFFITEVYKLYVCCYISDLFLASNVYLQSVSSFLTHFLVFHHLSSLLPPTCPSSLSLFLPTYFLCPDCSLCLLWAKNLYRYSFFLSNCFHFLLENFKSILLNLQMRNGGIVSDRTGWH